MERELCQGYGHFWYVPSFPCSAPQYRVNPLLSTTLDTTTISPTSSPSSSSHVPLAALHKRKVDYDEDAFDDSSVSKFHLFFLLFSHANQSPFVPFHPTSCFFRLAPRSPPPIRTALRTMHIITNSRPSHPMSSRLASSHPILFRSVPFIRSVVLTFLQAIPPLTLA